MAYIVTMGRGTGYMGHGAAHRAETRLAFDLPRYRVVDAGQLIRDTAGELVIVPRDPRPVERVLRENRLGIWR